MLDHTYITEAITRHDRLNAEIEGHYATEDDDGLSEYDYVAPRHITDIRADQVALLEQVIEKLRESREHHENAEPHYCGECDRARCQDCDALPGGEHSYNCQTNWTDAS
jgi:hypothetical protein